MKRFKILATIVFLWGVILEGLKCQSESPAKPSTLKTLTGLGAGAYGVYQLLSGQEKRRRQIQKEVFNYQKAFFNDLMKTDVVGQGTDMLSENYQKLRHNFNVFSSSVHNQVDTIRKSVRQFIQNSNYKIRLLTAQRNAAEGTEGSEQNDNKKPQKQKRRSRRLKKELAGKTLENVESRPLVVSDEFGNPLPTPHYIRLNVRRIQRLPKHKLNLAISHPKPMRMVL